MADLTGRRILIAGGSGFLGLSMAEYLSKAGGDVTILSRPRPKRNGGWSHASWDGRTLGIQFNVMQPRRRYIVFVENGFNRALRNTGFTVDAFIWVGVPA